VRGHIRAWRKPGTFKIWIELPVVDGKRQRETLVVHGSRKEAEAKLADRISAIERDDYSRSGKSTVADVTEKWLKARKPNIGAKTYNRYEGIVRDYIKPTLGEVRLRKLTPLHIEDALTKWRSAVPKKRKAGTLKPRSIHHVFSTLKAMLAQAKRWNLMSRNPCEAVDTPSKGHSEVLALDEDGALALLSGLRDTSLAAPVHIALLTGLRRGELLALRWGDVDLDRRVANVRRALEQLKGGACAVKDTKTKKSRRPVPLTTEAIDVLKAHRAPQNAIRLRSPGYNPEGLVFPDPATGDAWGPDRFSSAFYYRAHKLGIAITFHGLRHSFATIALRARVPMKMVSDILGHTTTAITADLYTHVLEDMQHEAADRVGEAFAVARRRSSSGALQAGKAN
jgi:integrase